MTGNKQHDAIRDQLQLSEDIEIIDERGEFVAVGSTAFVELLSTGDIIKRPWPSGDRTPECRRELAQESEIYDRLGRHPRLVEKKGWDPADYALLLEYMSNGTLKDYLCAHPDVSLNQRLKWAQQAAEGVHLLNSSGVVHCDVGPHNLLLDAGLDLKIADFGGSSVDNSSTNIRPGTRYTGPDLGWNWKTPPTPDNDIFSLGSTIYYIVTGEAPFDDVPSHEVEKRYRAREFPGLTGVPCADVIRRCWHQELRSAEAVIGLVKADMRDTVASRVLSRGTLLAALGLTSVTLAIMATALKPRRFGFDGIFGLVSRSLFGSR